MGQTRPTGSRGRAEVSSVGEHKRISLKQIAGITGYSITTISMVLNGISDKFSISKDTRDLILGVAKQHNYQPNLHARSLRSRTTDIVGLMVPTLYNRFFSEMAERFESLARKDRKVPLITVTHYEPEQEIDTLRYFASQNADCVFIANPMALEQLSGVCSAAGIRYIVLDSPDSVTQTVTTDNFDAARALTRMLLASMRAAGRGGRIYFIGGMVQHGVTQHRLAGFKAALLEQNIAVSDDQFVQTNFTEEATYEEIRRVFLSNDDIGGIFLNSLLPFDGLIRFFPEAPELCRQVHYGVFDYHPIMNLLADLHVLIVQQNPDGMMQKAYEIFSSDQHAQTTQQPFYVPYKIILTPAAKQLFPNPPVSPVMPVSN
jgi:DNA-binding LacI/PurR family transcriptional regulator